MTFRIDDVDKQLISLLRSDARMPVVNIARQLKVSRATVQNRMNRLERSGVIINYSVNVKAGVDSESVKALISIEAYLKNEKSIIEALRGMPSIAAIHHTAGRWDLIAEIHTDSLAAFNNVVNEVRLIDGVQTTESNLLLDSLIFKK